MHDFLLAKEIVDELKVIIKDKKLSGVKKARIEIGEISMAHDGHDEHLEDVNISNLEFGLQNITRGTILENTIFDIKKVAGDNWKIVDIEV